MPRKPQPLIWSEQAGFLIGHRGHNREVAFRDDEDRRRFLDLWQRYRDRFALKIYHYCLTSNDFLVLVQFEDARQLSSMMAGLLRSYVHYYHRRYGFVGHLWDGQFQSTAVELQTYQLRCGRFIERMPMSAGMVNAPWEYAWSSCRVYALGQEDALLAENRSYLELSTQPSRRQKLWRDYLMVTDDKAIAIDLEADTLGSTDFRRQTQHQRGRRQRRGPGRPQPKRNA